MIHSNSVPTRDSSRADAFPTAVLLGPDHVGKTSVARLLSRRGIAAVSCDDDLLDERYQVVSHVRKAGCGLLKHGASRELLVAGLELQVFYLRDEMLRRRRQAPVVVDSYHYKALAKCRLHRLVTAGMLSRWTQMEPPDHVFYLQLAPEALWERAGFGALVNAFEHYGSEVTREGFMRYQTDLGELMKHEIRAVPSSTIDAREPLDVVCNQVELTLLAAASGRRSA